VVRHTYIHVEHKDATAVKLEYSAELNWTDVTDWIKHLITIEVNGTEQRRQPTKT